MDKTLNAELSKKIQELQVLEHQAQQHAAQKQAVQVELNEIENALNELASTKEDVYRILGGIMVRAQPETLNKELGEKKRVLELRVQAVEKQEKLVEEKASTIRNELKEAVIASKGKTKA